MAEQGWGCGQRCGFCSVHLRDKRGPGRPIDLLVSSTRPSIFPKGRLWLRGPGVKCGADRWPSVRWLDRIRCGTKLSRDRRVTLSGIVFLRLPFGRLFGAALLVKRETRGTRFFFGCSVRGSGDSGVRKARLELEQRRLAKLDKAHRLAETRPFGRVLF